MSQPIISNQPLAPINSRQVDGRYIISHGQLVTLRFSVLSSGVPDPTVRVYVDWGDGSEPSMSVNPAGQLIQFTKTLQGSGDYFIVVTAVNSAGEESSVNQNTLVAIKVLQPRPLAERKATWSGLALPVSHIREGIKAVQDVVTAFSQSLSTQANEGDLFFFVDDDRVSIPTDTQVTLSQEGKLFTSARVVGQERNKINIDRELNDSYDPLVAKAEFKATKLRNDVSFAVDTESDWFFPTTEDLSLIKASISMILSTGFGERLMRPSFGSGIQELVFDQMDPITESNLRAAVAGAISRWEKRVEVVSTRVITDKNRNQTRLAITLKERRAGDIAEQFDIEMALTNPDTLS